MIVLKDLYPSITVEYLGDCINIFNECFSLYSKNNCDSKNTCNYINNKSTICDKKISFIINKLVY